MPRVVTDGVYIVFLCVSSSSISPSHFVPLLLSWGDLAGFVMIAKSYGKRRELKMLAFISRRTSFSNHVAQAAKCLSSGRTQVLGAAVEKSLNHQLRAEAEASHYYLACAGWAERRGYPGSASFMYAQYEEERQHMLKLIRYINDRGGDAVIPAIPQPVFDITSLFELFQSMMSHEQKVTFSVNATLGECLNHNDHITYSFIQWYAGEQVQEESTARSLLDRLSIIGDDRGGLYNFDKDIMSLRSVN